MTQLVHENMNLLDVIEAQSTNKQRDGRERFVRSMSRLQNSRFVVEFQDARQYVAQKLVHEVSEGEEPTVLEPDRRHEGVEHVGRVLDTVEEVDIGRWVERMPFEVTRRDTDIEDEAVVRHDFK